MIRVYLYVGVTAVFQKEYMVLTVLLPLIAKVEILVQAKGMPLLLFDGLVFAVCVR